MLTIRDIAFPYEIFGNILYFFDKKDLGRIALVCKGTLQATILFINTQSNSLAKAEKIEPEKKFFADSSAFKTILQWQQAFDVNNKKTFEKACKEDPTLDEKITKQAENLFAVALPMAIDLTDNLQKLDKNAEEFPGNFFDIFLNGVFKNMPAINNILEPNAPPIDQKITDMTHNMVSDFMHHMFKPESLTKLFGFAAAFEKSNFDENTPFGDFLVPTVKPICEMFHPLMAKHLETLGILSTDEEMHQMFDIMKKELNEQYGSLKEYLQKSKTQDEILENVLIELTGVEQDILATLDPQHPLANYQVDISHPKTDYEKGLAMVFSSFPSFLQEEIQEEIKPLLSKLVSLMYMSAGCQTPEEFQERTEKLLKLKDKAAEQIGRIQLLKYHKEQIIAILTAQASQAEFNLKNLDKVNQLFDIMEKDEEVEKSFNSIYQKATLHQFKLIKSILNNMSEELTGDVFDPLYTANASHRYIQEMLDQMSVYWKNLTQNVTDPTLKLQYDVSGFELKAMVPSTLRCGLHDKYERDLTKARRSKLLESGESKKQSNPIQLSAFDRTVWNYFVSINNLKEEMNLLKNIPHVDEQIMVETIVKQTNDKHRSMIEAFIDEVKIEEINE